MAGHEAKRKLICTYGNAINPPESFYNLSFRFFHYPKSDFITFVLYPVLKISFHNLAFYETHVFNAVCYRATGFDSGNNFLMGDQPHPTVKNLPPGIDEKLRSPFPCEGIDPQKRLTTYF